MTGALIKVLGVAVCFVCGRDNGCRGPFRWIPEIRRSEDQREDEENSEGEDKDDDENDDEDRWI